MARRPNGAIADDFDGSEATQTVLFGLDGKTYEIDLSEANAEKLRAILAPYIRAARLARRLKSAPPPDRSAVIAVEDWSPAIARHWRHGRRRP